MRYTRARETWNERPLGLGEIASEGEITSRGETTSRGEMPHCELHQMYHEEPQLPYEAARGGMPAKRCYLIGELGDVKLL